MLYLWAFPDMPSVYALQTSNTLKAEEQERAAWTLVTWENKAGPAVPFLPICGLNGLQLENIHVPTPNEGTCYKIQNQNKYWGELPEKKRSNDIAEISDVRKALYKQ